MSGIFLTHTVGVYMHLAADQIAAQNVRLPVRAEMQLVRSGQT